MTTVCGTCDQPLDTGNPLTDTGWCANCERAAAS